jgi:hypothetical protein
MLGWKLWLQQAAYRAAAQTDEYSSVCYVNISGMGLRFRGSVCRLLGVLYKVKRNT